MKKKKHETTASIMIEFGEAFRRKQESFRKKLRESETYIERYLRENAKNSITS